MSHRIPAERRSPLVKRRASAWFSNDQLSPPRSMTSTVTSRKTLTPSKASRPSAQKWSPKSQPTAPKNLSASVRSREIRGVCQSWFVRDHPSYFSSEEAETADRKLKSLLSLLPPVKRRNVHVPDSIATHASEGRFCSWEPRAARYNCRPHTGGGC